MNEMNEVIIVILLILIPVVSFVSFLLGLKEGGEIIRLRERGKCHGVFADIINVMREKSDEYWKKFNHYGDIKALMYAELFLDYLMDVDHAVWEKMDEYTEDKNNG